MTTLTQKIADLKARTNTDDFDYIETIAILDILVEDNRKLREALLQINGYAQHDDDCTINDWHKIPECKCGYTDAWGQAQDALTETNPEREI